MASAPMRPTPRPSPRIFAGQGAAAFQSADLPLPRCGAAFRHVEAERAARALAAAFWPGPLTLVLPRRVTCPVALLAGAGLDTLAVRVPGASRGAALCCARSAGRSRRPRPTARARSARRRAAHVLDGLGGRIAAVLDSGACPVGVESTVLDLTGGRPVPAPPRRRRRWRRSRRVVGPVGRGIPPAAAEPRARCARPGLLVSHYAPDLPVRLERPARRGPTRRCSPSGRRCRGAAPCFS